MERMKLGHADDNGETIAKPNHDLSRSIVVQGHCCGHGAFHFIPGLPEPGLLPLFLLSPWLAVWAIQHISKASEAKTC